MEYGKAEKKKVIPDMFKKDLVILKFLGFFNVSDS